MPILIMQLWLALRQTSLTLRRTLGNAERARLRRPILRGAMSTVPPKADMCSATGHACFGPKADTRLIRRRQIFELAATSLAVNRSLIAPVDEYHSSAKKI